jgi:copper transport protein
LPLRFLLLVTVAALVLPPGAWAHARLLRSEPPDGSVLAAPPAVVRFVFDDRVRLAPDVKAIRNGGGSVLAGKPRVVGGRTLVVPLRARLADGDYTVLWRVLSDDGHTLAGVVAFAVGQGRAPPTPALTANNGPTTQDVLARLLFFAGLLSAAGVAFFRFAVAPVSVRLLVGAFLLVFVGAGGMLHGVSLSTRFGAVMAGAALVAGVGALLAAVAPIVPRLAPFAFATALALLPAPSLAGHALDRGRSWVEPLADVAHVAAASVWLGGVLSLALVLREPGDRRATLRRFSNVALVAVVVLAATGVIRAFSELRSFGQLWSTGYGRVLLVKTLLLLLLAGTGWLNRYRLVPRLALRGIRRNLAVELALLAALVAAVALLTDLRPGRDRAAVAAAVASGPPPLPAPDAVVQAQEVGDRVVALAVRGGRGKVLVLGPDGGGVNGLRVEIAGVEAPQCGSGCYGAVASPAGTVKVAVDGRTLRFSVPARPRPAPVLVGRATRAFRLLRSVDYVERLASSPRNRVIAEFTLEAPNRLEYRIRGGASGIVIGSRRWDRALGQPWVASGQSLTPQPEPIWAGGITNAFLLQATPSTYIVSFFKPLGPAWFIAYLDRRTLLPRELAMTAPSHFMTHRYTRFNGPRRIRPPGS